MLIVFSAGAYALAFIPDRGDGRFQLFTPSGDVEISMQSERVVRGFCDPEDARVPLSWAGRHFEQMKRATRHFERAFVSDRTLPRIDDVVAHQARIVLVKWRSGGQRAVDLQPALDSLVNLSTVLADDRLFRSIRVGRLGATVEWADGTELSALWIEELSLGQMESAEFRWAMETMGLTLDGMAACLGLSRRTVADYRKNRPIPRSIALATNYLIDLRGIQRPTS
jgi:hypothetical protein